MKLPAFDKNGDISMGEVMRANPEDFEVFGVRVSALLKELKTNLKSFNPNNYNKQKSGYIHELLSEHETGNGRMRKPFYQHSALFCFYYNIYVKFISNPMYYHLSGKKEQELDQKMINSNNYFFAYPYEKNEKK